MKKLHILHLEDNVSDAQLILNTLKHNFPDLDVHYAETQDEFEQMLVKPELEIVLADYSLPTFNGLAALELLKEKRPELPFILISGTIGEEKAIEIFQKGATDYISKDSISRVPLAITRALTEVSEKDNRKKIEIQLKEKERLFNQFTKNIHEVFWKATPNMDRIIYVSPAYEKIWGRTVEEVYLNNRDWLEAVVPEEQQAVLNAFTQFIEGDETHMEFSFNILRSDGEKRFIIVQSSKVTHNNTFEIIGVSTDGTERENIRLQLVASLKEKDEMLREIYHRVKNNLQVVNSLLNLQAKSIKNEHNKKIFTESSTRIKAMGLVHEMLYRTGDLTRIEIGKYASELFRHLNEIYKTSEGKIQFKIKGDGVELNLENAVPCGLMYAFG